MQNHRLWIGIVTAAVLGAQTPALAEETKAGAPPTTTWAVLDDKGKALGTELIRIVRHADGAVFASGEAKVGPKNKRRLVRTHVQRKADGALVKYQRMDGGAKADGVRVFEFDGKTRIVPVTGGSAGKPTDLADPIRAGLVDGDTWHLLALWAWPSECKPNATIATFDLAARKGARTAVRCVGTERVTDPKKTAVAVDVWEFTAPGGDLKVFVERGGRVVGVRGAKRQMLLNQWSWQGVAAVADEPGEGEGEDAELKERGAGP
jgi:hypothetical protein